MNGGARGSTPQGGGLDQVAFGTASLYDTIIASNSDLTTGSPVASDIGGTVNSASAYNVIGTGGSGGLINGGNHSLVGVVTPGLGTLGYYGGLTQTLPLLFGSAAFDTGSATISGVTVPVFDQRGALRGPAGLDAGTTFDIGSVRSQLECPGDQPRRQCQSGQPPGRPGLGQRQHQCLRARRNPQHDPVRRQSFGAVLPAPDHHLEPGTARAQQHVQPRLDHRSRGEAC